MAEPVGGPWTRHGHPVSGVTVEGAGRPGSVARCGGPGLCKQCSVEAESIRATHARRVALMGALMKPALRAAFQAGHDRGWSDAMWEERGGISPREDPPPDLDAYVAAAVSEGGKRQEGT